MPLDEVVHVVSVLCRVLEATHVRGIIHRDLKPENVFLIPQAGGLPAVKLLDFGVAKLLVHDLRACATQIGSIIGTPAYMSPEQARLQPIDGRTDIYSLGVLLFEMLTGRRPFASASVPDVIADHVHTPAPRVRDRAPELPASLDRLVAAMLRKNPAARPSPRDIRAGLAGLELGEARTGKGGVSWDGPRTEVSRRRGRALGVRLAGLAAAVAVGALAGVAWNAARVASPAAAEAGRCEPGAATVVTHSPGLGPAGTPLSATATTGLERGADAAVPASATLPNDIVPSPSEGARESGRRASRVARPGRRIAPLLAD
jgi:hypothetical protein